jgi:hypothetical protein
MLRSGYATVAAYLATGIGYIALSVFFPDAILSWVEGATVLVIVFGLVPYLYRRLRR